MLSGILQKLFILVIGLLLLASAAAIFFRLKNVNKTERNQIFKTAEYLNAWVILICFIISITFGFVNHFQTKKSAYAIVSLNYSEASQALNSNGTRYNMAEIISDEVVAKAIEKGALRNVTVQQLKNCLVVYPNVQGGVNDNSQYHISTEFVVKYYASKYTSHLNSESVVSLITTAYKDYYIEKYTDNFSLDAEAPDFSEMEYMDIVSYLDKEATAVLNYLYGMAAKSSSFTTSNNATFNSIAGKVFQFKETQIDQNLKALVLQHGIARNKAGYIDRLSYQNTNTDFSKQRNKISFDLCNQAIDMYSEEMTRVVLVPTWDESGKYYMGRTKVGIDELSVMATSFSDNVATSEKEIMDNNLVIEKMLSSPENASATAEADALIQSIDESIDSFTTEAIAAGREYSNHRMNQCIAVSISGISLFGELKTIILFMMLAYASAVLFVISKKFPKS